MIIREMLEVKADDYEYMSAEDLKKAYQSFKPNERVVIVGLTSQIAALILLVARYRIIDTEDW